MPGFEWIGAEEKAAVGRVFDEGGTLLAHGFEARREHFHVREFESECEAAFGASHCLAVSSGTAAVKIALKAADVSPGDEVITQAFNFIATIEAILDCGAEPIIANVDNTLNLDPRELENLITPKTRAIVPVHMLGVPAEMEAIWRIAADHELSVVEDACESVGAKYQGKSTGTLGYAGAMSFDHGKMITTGEGGLVLTNSESAERIAREYHDHGHENNPDLPRGRDTRSRPGFNFRMTELQAAMGKAQLEKLPAMIEANCERVTALEEGLAGAFPCRMIPEDCAPTHDTFILTESDSAMREQMVSRLSRDGFGTKNLPDALEWHCAACWDHALPASQVAHSRLTLQRLEQSVAIPIWLGKSTDDYLRLGEKLKHLKSSSGA